MAAWHNEPPVWKDEDGVLTVKTARETDFWNNTFYRFRHDNRHLRAKTWNLNMPRFEPGERVDVAVEVEDDPYSAQRGYSPWGLSLKDVRYAV